MLLQVDVVIKEATNMDNLAQLYEGWTAWVWVLRCFMSLVQRRLGDPPQPCGAWVLEEQHQATQGGVNGRRMLRPPFHSPGQPNWGQRPRGIAATTLPPPQPPETRLTQCLVGLQTHLPFSGFGWVENNPVPDVGRGGREGKGLLALRLGNPFPPYLHSSPSSCTYKHPCIRLRAGWRSELFSSEVAFRGDWTGVPSQMDRTIPWALFLFTFRFCDVWFRRWAGRWVWTMKTKDGQDSSRTLTPSKSASIRDWWWSECCQI